MTARASGPAQSRRDTAANLSGGADSPFSTAQTFGFRLVHCVLITVRTACLDVDCHTHPRMNTALKKVFALRQIRDLQLAALKDTSPGYRDDP